MPTRERRLNGLRKQAHAFNGVYFDRANEKFKTQVSLNGTTHYFGYYKTPQAAAIAVNEGVKQVLGSKKAAMQAGVWNEVN